MSRVAMPWPTSSVLMPIEALGSRASAIGHLNANADVDGGIRAEPLVLRYYDQFFPFTVTDGCGEEPQPRAG
jgi:hypothetical protein